MEEEEYEFLRNGQRMHDSIDIANITKKQFPTKKTLEIFNNFLKEKIPSFKTTPGESVTDKYFSQIYSDIETPYNETLQFKFKMDNLLLSFDSIVKKKSDRLISRKNSIDTWLLYYCWGRLSSS